MLTNLLLYHLFNVPLFETTAVQHAIVCKDADNIQYLHIV